MANSKKTKKQHSTAAKKRDLISQKKKFFVSFFAALVVLAAGSYLLVTNAATNYYRFVGVGDKCLDNWRQRKVKGNKIELYTCNKTSAQQWTINKDGTIRNKNGYCLDVKYAGTKPRTPVWLWPCNGTVAQEWVINNTDGSIVNPHSGLCLDDKYARTNNGNEIWMWHCNGTVAQRWVAKKIATTKPPAPEPTPTPAPTPSPTPTPTPEPKPTAQRDHFIQNSWPSDAKKLKGLGYTVVDANPDETSAIKGLPDGVKAMVWTGDAFCDSNIMSWNSFRKLVYDNRNNDKIYGYFLEDEPNVKGCPHIVRVMRDRADYIHCLAYRGDTYSNGKRKVADDGSCLDANGNKIARKTNKKAYIVDEYNYDYSKVRESLVHADIFAIDPYPCRSSSCKYSGDPDYFKERIARAKQYYSASKIAPTYQAFGGDGWKLPSASQMKTIQAEFDKALPNSILDVAYSYRDNKTGGPGDTYPGLIHAPSSLVDVMKAHNLKY